MGGLRQAERAGQLSLRGRWRLDHRALIAILAGMAAALDPRAAGPWLLAALGLWCLGRAATGSVFGRLRVGTRLRRTHVFAGERVALGLELHNPCSWPLAWLVVEARAPDGLTGGLAEARGLPGRARLRLEARWLAARRGVYVLGGLDLRGGDWFGLSQDARRVAPTCTLVVYPRVWPLSLPSGTPRLPQGPRLDRASPFEDDLPTGLRPYRQGDPWRRIAWRASARHDGLWVREHPPVRERVLCVLLDLCPSAWADRDAGPERALSLAASLLMREGLNEQPVGLGVWAGTAVRGASEPDAPARVLWLPPQAGWQGRRRVLSLLAGVTVQAGMEFDQLVDRLAPRLPWGAQVLWILPWDPPALRRRAALWQARGGRSVSLLCLERREGPPLERVAGGVLRTWEVSWRGGFEFV